MKIRIKEFRRHKSGYLQAFCDLEILDIGLTIKGCRVFQKDKRAWINTPQEQFMADGEKKYKTFLYFDDAHKDVFQANAIAAIRKWVENENEKASAPPMDSTSGTDVPF